MRNFRLWLIIVVAAVLSTVSASYAGEPETKRMNFVWSLESEYPVFGDERIDSRILEWLDTSAGHFLEEAKNFTAPEIPDGAFTIGISYELSRPSDAAVSVIWNIYTFPKYAAHPLSSIEVQNFNLADGKLLELADLFAKPEEALVIFSEHAPALISADFKNDLPNQFPDGVEDDAWFKDGFLPKPENYASFSLEPEGIRLHFSLYQVLPYVFGMPSPLVPLSLLEAAGPNRVIWPQK